MILPGFPWPKSRVPDEAEDQIVTPQRNSGARLESVPVPRGSQKDTPRRPYPPDLLLSNPPMIVPGEIQPTNSLRPGAEPLWRV